MYLYESHLGSLYLTDYEKSFEDLYCEQCGDYDRLVGEFNSAIDALIYMANDINIDGSGGWDLRYVLKELSIFEDCPEYSKAENIVRENRLDICENISEMYPIDKFMCENISEMHPVDEFICSECGLIMRDLMRYEYDEDKGDESCYEFEFKYCPRCGRKVVE